MLHVSNFPKNLVSVLKNRDTHWKVVLLHVLLTLTRVIKNVLINTACSAFASRKLLLELTGDQEKWISFLLQEYSQKMFFSFGLHLGNSLGTLMKSVSNKQSVSGKCGGVNNKRSVLHHLPDLWKTRFIQSLWLCCDCTCHEILLRAAKFHEN